MKTMKEHLGNAVYAEFNGICVVVTMQDEFGLEVSTHLEPGLIRKLNKYVQQIPINGNEEKQSNKSTKDGQEGRLW